ncbi:hypothetical protein ACQ7CX_23200 [Chryseobacterium arthrosphaerae]|uniref:hypothetical protein n=1 Tax=Chryseobacterium arthrosphaerae TaxID=651561 RepID=UPI001BB04E17|nr:hypothetical protein [Chryseobacterium arthrosphaerae]QUY55930.1 hypothetical protein I2F65_00735 [Chryseobacterium arthrosphaerae]
MKNLFHKEKNKLTLTIKYAEHLRTQKNSDNNTATIRYVPCKKYQTDYLLKERPIKSFTRLL